MFLKESSYVVWRVCLGWIGSGKNRSDERFSAKVDMNVLRWFGHLTRINNELLTRNAMNAKYS